MSAISANLVRDLRELSGAGMMDCKKALERVLASGATGSTEEILKLAVEEMRKLGQAAAAKKASRSASEGLIAVRVSADHRSAIMLEVNSETDFVARDQSFNDFVKAVADLALTHQIQSLDALLSASMNSGQTVDQARQALMTKIGENINVRRFVAFSSTGALGAYVHGGRIGVILELDGKHPELAKDLAMHVAASNPLVVSSKDVPAELLAKEREIYMAQAMGSGKPQAIAEKMVEGRMRKFLEEVSLLGQPFVKDPSILVGDLVKKSQTNVLRFTRFELGEGIEKKVVDFAKEVMEQVRGG